MLIEDYDKPLTLRSPVSRTSSSASLKDQLSPDLTSEVKIYRKMSIGNGQQRQRHQPPHDTTCQSLAANKRYFHTVNAKI